MGWICFYSITNIIDGLTTNITRNFSEEKIVFNQIVHWNFSKTLWNLGFHLYSLWNKWTISRFCYIRWNCWEYERCWKWTIQSRGDGDPNIFSFRFECVSIFNNNQTLWKWILQSGWEIGYFGLWTSFLQLYLESLWFSTKSQILKWFQEGRVHPIGARCYPLVCMRVP